MVSHPREWKKIRFQMLAVPSNLFYGRFQRMRSQANKCQVRLREQKQRSRNGTSELGVFVCAWVGVYCSLTVSVHVSMCLCCVCVCVVLGCSGRWNHAPPRTGSPWLALTRIADHINATTHLSLLPFLPASCSLLLLPSAVSVHALPDVIKLLHSLETHIRELAGGDTALGADTKTLPHLSYYIFMSVWTTECTRSKMHIREVKWKSLRHVAFKPTPGQTDTLQTFSTKWIEIREAWAWRKRRRRMEKKKFCWCASLIKCSCRWTDMGVFVLRHRYPLLYSLDSHPHINMCFAFSVEMCSPTANRVTGSRLTLSVSLAE